MFSMAGLSRATTRWVLHFSRRRVAAELEMSVLPVAEALKRLENEGVLETRARIGTRIKIPSPGEVRGLLELREALECESARLFSQRATSQDKR